MLFIGKQNLRSCFFSCIALLKGDFNHRGLGEAWAIFSKYILLIIYVKMNRAA